MTTVQSTANREITISRLIHAPRELVFDAWTDPKHLIKWWGPQGFTNTFHEINVKPGGVWRFIMHGPDGVDYPNFIIFRELVKPERITWTHGEDENEATHFQSSAIFEREGNHTRLTLKSLFPTAEERDRVIREYGAIEGGNSTLDSLEEYVAQMISNG